MSNLHRWWQSWAQRSTLTEPDTDGEPSSGTVGAPASQTRRLWLLLGLGLIMALVVAYVMVALNRETVRLSHPSTIVAAMSSSGEAVQSLGQAWVVRSNDNQFPTGQAGHLATLPDEWSKSQSGYQGAIWYRFHFDAKTLPAPDQIMAILIERACSNVEVQLNGQLLYRGGRMTEPYARNCYRSHVVTLPTHMLREHDNQLDLKIVGYPINRVTARQRAGGLAAVRVGPLQEIRELYEEQEFWTMTVSQVLGGILAVLGVFALGLAWVRRLDYLLYFGLLTIGWSMMTGRMWLSDVLVPNAGVEVLIAMMFAPMTAFAIKFLLGYAGQSMGAVNRGARRRQLNAVLWAQCVLLPISLLLAGADRLFIGARIWYVLFAFELFVTIGFFLWVAGKNKRTEFWLMSAALGVVSAVLGIELTYQSGLVRMWGVHVTHFVMPLLYAAVAVRLIQVYARALQTAEGARKQLEKRVQEISGEIERNFNQIAELRVEQIAEKERKRIAADLHDDLGAKLLTIVHTSDNDRISTLAREALEEMRLSVRGLTGRPMVLSDALADWRAEVVSRLGQAGIECEWRNPNDVIEEPLSSRTYVQTTRILREAVSNVIKHSGASHVVISAEVHLDHHDFVLVIQDNGKGIPLELDGRLDRGHGMTSMKHRAKQLSGQCLVESGPGFGTVIRLTLPLEIATMQQVLPTAMSGSSGAASMRNIARGH
ncbi:MAG: sensor histidine kinase [Burkholderiales bacterium]|nr:MAG: sensor histidine kinase [Burkholderiales bacterium]